MGNIVDSVANHTTIWIRLWIVSLSFCRLVVWRFRSRTWSAISRVRIPTTARQSGSEVRMVVSTFISLIQYVYINRSSTDVWSTGWRQMNLVHRTHEQMRNYKTWFQSVAIIIFSRWSQPLVAPVHQTPINWLTLYFVLHRKNMFGIDVSFSDIVYMRETLSPAQNWVTVLSKYTVYDQNKSDHKSYLSILIISRNLWIAIN